MAVRDGDATVRARRDRRSCHRLRSVSSNSREHGGVEHFGEYVEVAAPRRLVFSLLRSDRPRAATRVTVEIEPHGRGCKLSLAHEHVPLDLVRITETRWIGMLYGLGVTLGSGARDPQSPAAIVHARDRAAATRSGAALPPRQLPTPHQPREPMMQVNPYLMFNGRCEEAFRFYEKALGGKIVAMLPHKGTPAEAHVPAEWRNKIMHAQLDIGDYVLMALRLSAGTLRKPAGFSVSLQVKDAGRKRIELFNALAEKGEIQMPIDKTFWSPRFGMLVDRFGIPWMINCDPQS